MKQPAQFFFVLALLSFLPGTLATRHGHAHRSQRHLRVLKLEAKNTTHEPQAQEMNQTSENVSGLVKVKNIVLKELEYELKMHTTPYDGPKKLDKLKWTLIVQLLGGWLWGCDRCFAGQVTAGVLKGVTCGGCFVWGVIDLIYATINIILCSGSATSLGYSVIWKEDTIDHAFYAYVCIAAFNVLTMYFKVPQKADETFEERAPDQHAQATQLRRQGTAEVKSAVRRTSGTNLVGQPDEHEIIEILRKSDVDGNGKIDQNELPKALDYLGVDSEEREIYQKLAAVHDQSIDIKVFAQAVMMHRAAQEGNVQ